MKASRFRQIRDGYFPVNGFSTGSTVAALPLWLALMGCLSPLPAAAQQTAPAPAAAPAQHPQSDATYRIGAGDILEISIWNEPEASVPAVVVRPDGKVSLPLIKDVSVVGLTPMDVQQMLASKLEKMIRGADVTVVVREVHSKRVYLVGQVAKVGPMPLTSDDTTVLQALAEAGGVTPYAKKGKIYVLRVENGKEVKLPFHYNSVIKGEHLEENIVLRPDDTIVVP